MKTTMLIFLVALARVSAGTVILSFNTDTLRYRLTFDPSVISEAEVKTLVVFSPYTGEDSREPFWVGRSVNGETVDKIFMAPPIERCVVGDPEYFGCGKPDVRSPYFYKNAQVNLAKGGRQLALLNRMAYPKELHPVVQYLGNFLAFSLWLEETRFEFYKSWKTKVLRRKYKGFQPSAACAEVLEEIEKASTKEDKYKLAQFDWYNCFSHCFHSRLGIYPIQAWKNFLTAYGIKEEHRYIGPD